MNRRVQKIVLTGGPGVGKTSIIQCLQGLGYEVREEVFTKLFAEAQKLGIFSEAFLRSEELIHKLLSAQKNLECQSFQGELMFLDRSRVDILGYAKNMGIHLSDEDRSWLQKNEYDLIFIVQPLPDKLYDQNAVRRQTQQESLEHHRSVKQHYLDFLSINRMEPADFLIEVPYFEGGPTESVLKRTNFILKEIKNRQLR